MVTQLLTEKYADNLDGVLGCYDRIVITGSLAELCYPKGATGYLYARDIRIFDYPHGPNPCGTLFVPTPSRSPRRRA